MVGLTGWRVPGAIAGIVGVLGVGGYILMRQLAPQPIPVALVPFVHFDASMRALEYPDAPSHDWGPVVYPMLKHLFEYNYRAPDAVQVYRIPQIIHQIWLGSPVPAALQKYVDRWKAAHPTWEYKLWTERDIEALGLRNKALYMAATNYGVKSTIARYEIIYRFGGVYIDMDFECIQALDAVHQSYDMYIGIHPLDAGHIQVGVGMFGARPEHPLLAAAIDHLHKSVTAEQVAHVDGSADRASVLVGHLFFTPIFYQLAPLCTDRVMVFPASYMYPRGCHQSAYERSAWLRPESFAVHHWEGWWRKPEGSIPAMRTW